MTEPLRSQGEDLQAGLSRFLAAVLAQGLTQEARESLGRIRQQFERGRAEILEQQKATLRASLPPPAKAQALKSLRPHLAILDSSLSRIDAVLQQVAA